MEINKKWWSRVLPASALVVITLLITEGCMSRSSNVAEPRATESKGDRYADLEGTRPESKPNTIPSLQSEKRVSEPKPSSLPRIRNAVNASDSGGKSVRGYPRIESLGDQAIISFDKTKDLVIPIRGQDLGLLPDTAWSVSVCGVSPATRGVDYHFKTLANSPTDANVSYNKAAVVLHAPYLQTVRDGDVITVTVEISKDPPATKAELKHHLAVAKVLEQDYQSNKGIQDKATALTNQVALAMRLFPMGELRGAPSDVLSMKIRPDNAEMFIHAMEASLENYDVPNIVTLASGARRFVLYSAESFRTDFLQRRVPLSDIKAFPLPDDQVKWLLGPDVMSHFYVISLSFENSSDRDRVINTGMINAYGRVLVAPTNTTGPDFSIPVEISPQSLQQVYTIIAGHKPYSVREGFFRTLEFGGGLATSIATGFKGSPDLIKALGVATGVGVPGLKTLWPDPVPNYLQNIVTFSMPELIKIPAHSAKGYQLLYFSKDNLNSMISDTQLFRDGKPPKQHLAFLSFDTLEVPFEVSVQATNQPSGAPLITSALPAAQLAHIGESITLSINATGTLPLSYQWSANGSDISGATASSLKLDNLATVNAGKYSVRISNSSGSITSPDVILTVNSSSPSITVQPPNNIAIKAGNSATLTVLAVGNSPLTYQWVHDDSDITGATLSALTFESAKSADSGKYKVRIANSLGAQTSTETTVSVKLPPSITTQPASATSATVGGNVTLSVTAAGTPPLAYQWVREGTAISGATLSRLVQLSVKEADSGKYTVKVSNTEGEVTSTDATVSVGLSPTITTQPAVATSAAVGATLTLTVIATGTPPLAYQWLHDGTAIPDATLSSLTIANLKRTDAGKYAVRVSNAQGPVTSSHSNVTVNP